MAATTRPKPWETKGGSSPSSFRVSPSVANGRNAPDVPDTGNIGTPTSPNAALHIGGRSGTSSATNSTSLSPSSSPSVPPRPNSLASSSPYGNSMYNSGYGGGYGNSSYGYGSRYGSSAYGSGYGGYGSSYGSSAYGSSYGGYGSSGYGSSYGSRYGSSYGGYGGYGSGYGSSYGGSYGGYGGPSSYGQMGPNHQEGAFGAVMQNGYNQINRFGQMMDAFSRFSRLLDANFEAMHGSFASVIRLMEVFGEFVYVIRTFAIFRVLSLPLEKLWKVLSIMLGRKSASSLTHHQKHKHIGDAPFDVQEFNNHQNAGKKPQRRSFMFFLIMAISCLSAPAILMKLWEVWKQRRLLTQKENGLDGVWQQHDESLSQTNQDMNNNIMAMKSLPGGFKARALFEFRGESPQDLSFRKDEIITVLDRSFPDWWEGQTIDGRRGFFPQNFVQAVE